MLSTVSAHSTRVCCCIYSSISRVTCSSTAPKKKPKDGQEPPPRVVALDLKHFDPVEGAAIVVGDFRQDKVRAQLDELLGGCKPNVVLSDMAPSFSGNFLTDNLKAAFDVVKAMKPQSPRPESTEMFLVAKGLTVSYCVVSDDSEESRLEEVEAVGEVTCSGGRAFSLALLCSGSTARVVDEGIRLTGCLCLV
ncbi:hypothetical protein BBJ29_009990 [Phytophthora kernoviae]|uniref:rRNA methyltransferase 2, mitochondrial n=1 Tax=Phytophthora kernoviae TaxID=325452 RepID=A0A3R7JM31_9STRA|nr:hypothetical protein BBJ29_009990 [Phytophthora kernoviae]